MPYKRKQEKTRTITPKTKLQKQCPIQIQPQHSAKQENSIQWLHKRITPRISPLKHFHDRTKTDSHTAKRKLEILPLQLK